MNRNHPPCTRSFRSLWLVRPWLAVGLLVGLLAGAGLANPPAASTPEILDELVPRLMVRHHVPGGSVVGIERHRVVWKRQYGVCRAGGDRKVDEHTLFEACSMSKPVFAYAVLKLVEQGRLDLDKPLVEYLDEPYLPDEPRHRAITTRMVLCHTCGFPNWRKKGEPLRVLFEPGSRFEYSGEGYAYLQHVVEHVTGQPLEKWIHVALLDPVGMKTSSFAWNDRVARLVTSGHDDEGRLKTSGPRFLKANAAASLFVSPSEYALFLLEMMRPDRSAPHSLGKCMLDQMLSRASKADPRRPITRLSPATSEVVHYGLGWPIDSTPQGDRVYHPGTNGGGYCCYNEFDPRQGRGLVIMTNSLSGEKLWRDVVAAVAP